jgi:hypothetical protein
MASHDREPVKLTEKMREEITEEEPTNNMIKPLDIISPPTVERDYEERGPPPEAAERSYIKTASTEEQKRSLERTNKEKTNERENKEARSISKLRTELRKHSDARKKTDVAIQDIEKQLKSLLLSHHTAIRDLRKDITRLRKSIAAAESKKILNKKRTNKRSQKMQPTKTKKTSKR